MGNKDVIRRFTQEDWYGFAGAAKFRDGSEPFIYQHDMNDGKVELTITVDRDAIQLTLTGDGGSDAWSKDVGGFSALRAEGELRHMVKLVEKFEYAPDLSYALDHDSEGFKGFEYMGEY